MIRNLKKAVRKYLDGQSVASTAREIGVNENTIDKWKKDSLSVNGEAGCRKASDAETDFRTRTGE